MFVPFLYELRRRKVPVGTHDAVALAAALAHGLHESSLDGFYFVARALLVHSQAHLDAFDQACADAYDKRAPNLVAEHAFRLSQSFSKFYAACPVLGAPEPAVRASRLALSATTLRQLETALDLLGIETPEQM